MDDVTVVTTRGANGAIIRTTTFKSDHIDYIWLVLGLVAAVLIAGGLRKLFWNPGSN